MLFPSVLPSISGICDESNFYLGVKYGSQGNDFQTWVGGHHLTDDVAAVYNFQENGTHFSLIVPYNAKHTAFEVYLKVGLELSAWINFDLLQIIASNSIRARIDLLLYDPVNNRALADLYLACTFPLITTSMCCSNTLGCLQPFINPLGFQHATLMER